MRGNGAFGGGGTNVLEACTAAAVRARCLCESTATRIRQQNLQWHLRRINAAAQAAAGHHTCSPYNTQCEGLVQAEPNPR